MPVFKKLGSGSSPFASAADSPLVPRGITVPVGQPGGGSNLRSLESRNGSTGLSRKVRGSQPRGDSVASGTSTPVIHKQRRCGSMKRMMYLGALVLGVTVCSQSFGFELLDRMLGHKGCASCCEPGCDAGNGCCEPGCDAGNGNGCAEPACGAGNGCAEPACDAGAGCCEPSCGAGSSCCGMRKKHDLFGGIKGLFAKCKRKHSCCGTSCCEPACDAGNGCCEPACGAGNGCAEPACDAGNGCCEPACDAGAGCCEPSCGAASCCGGRKAHKHVLRDLIAALKAKHARKSCCGTSCCGGEPACSAGIGCCEPSCCAEPACGAGCAPAAEPTPDASASVKTARTVASK